MNISFDSIAGCTIFFYKRKYTKYYKKAYEPFLWKSDFLNVYGDLWKKKSKLKKLKMLHDTVGLVPTNQISSNLNHGCGL